MPDRPMSQLLEELRDSCCRLMAGAFKLKCREEDEQRLERKLKEKDQEVDIEPFVNPWTKLPTE